LADTAFNESKSHIKALEYAALGVPVIAADLAPYNGFVVDGVTGYLVSTEDEWRARLTELINDEAAREAMGAAAKERAAEFVIQRGWRLWADAFEEVC
jgi:glycosyltransferase involved in cell wall biosynthesis